MEEKTLYLENFKELNEYEELFLKSDLHTFQEIQQLTITDFLKLGLNFSQGYKLINLISEIEKNINNINTDEAAIERVYKIFKLENISVNENNNFALDNENTIYYQSENDELAMIGLSVRSYNALKKSGYKSISELINLEYEDLEKIQGLGKKSIDEIINKVLEIKKTLSKENEPQNLNEKISKMRVSIDEFKFKNILISEFPSLKFISPDSNYTFYEYFRKLESGLKEENIDYEELNKQLTQINYVLEHQNYNLYLEIEPKKMAILKDRIKGRTLESIANDYGVTRERIRQIATKVKNKIKCYANQNRVNELFIGNIHIKEKNTSLLDDESYNNYFELIDLITENNRVDYDGKTVFVSNELIDKIANIEKTVSDEIENNGLILKDDIDFMDIDEKLVSHFLKAEGISESKGCYHKGNSIYDKLMAFIEKYKVLNLSKEEIDHTTELLDNLFGLRNLDKRNIEAALCRKGAVSLGDGQLTIMKWIPDIEPIVFSKIKSKIYFEKIICANSLFEIFKMKLSPEFTPNALYFKLKKECSEEFNFGGTNLMISVSGVEPSIAANVKKYVSEAEMPTANINIFKEFKIDNIALNIIINQDDTLFYIDNIYIWTLDNMKIDEILSDCFLYIQNKKSFYLMDLYKKIIQLHLDEMVKNFITTFERFNSLINKKFKDELKKFEFDKGKKYYFKKEEEKLFGFDVDF